MRYIVFGCGDNGKEAVWVLGYARVVAFVDNYCVEKKVIGKPVISFKEMQDVYKREHDTVVVVASIKYYKEMEYQLNEAGIERYFVFNRKDRVAMQEKLPYYIMYRKEIHLSYAQVLSKYPLINYKEIVINGVNEYLPYLVTEVMAQSPQANISIVVQDSYNKKIYTVGKPILPVSEINCGVDCIINNLRRPLNNIDNVNVQYIDLYDVDKYETLFYHKELERYKNIHNGERVFLIGNGPSLKIDDLNKLHDAGEICIGFNKIYRAYDRTLWRADYVAFSDSKVIEDCKNDMTSISGEIIVADTYHFDNNEIISDIQYIHMVPEQYYPNYPRFSSDIIKGVYHGMSVIYDIGIQLAAYMGFSEIYLLGVDHNMSGNVAQKGNHFLDEYITDEEAINYEELYFEGDKITRAFEMAEKYSKEHGFKIFNATRGGKLEVFERVDFDSLF